MPQSQPQLISYNTNDFFYMTAPMDTTDDNIGSSNLNTNDIKYSLPTYNTPLYSNTNVVNTVTTISATQYAYFPTYTMPWINDQPSCKTQCDSNTNCYGYAYNYNTSISYAASGKTISMSGCFISTNIGTAELNSLSGIAASIHFSGDGHNPGIISTKNTTISLSHFDNTNTYLNAANTIDHNQKNIAKMRTSIAGGRNDYNKALLANYDLAQQLQSIKNTSMNSDQMYLETKSLYSRELLMTINLVVGLIIAAIFIYFNR